MRIKAEYAELRAAVGFPEVDHNPELVEGRMVVPEPKPVNTEHYGMKQALETLEIAKSRGLAPNTDWIGDLLANEKIKKGVAA